MVWERRRVDMKQTHIDLFLSSNKYSKKTQKQLSGFTFEKQGSGVESMKEKKELVAQQTNRRGKKKKE